MSTTKLKATHSPLPWHDDGYRVHAATEDADKRNGRVIFEYKHVDDPNDADYPFIVRAVNSHADMLEALEETLSWIVDSFTDEEDQPQGIVSRAQAAIAKARGKE